MRSNQATIPSNRAVRRFGAAGEVEVTCHHDGVPWVMFASSAEREKPAKNPPVRNSASSGGGIVRRQLRERFAERAAGSERLRQFERRRR